MHKIHIEVKEDASVKIDYSHFAGTDCLTTGKQLHALLASLGVHVEESTITPKPELLAAQELQQDVTANVETMQAHQTEE